LTTAVKNLARPSKNKTIGIEYAYYELFRQFGDVRIVTVDQDPDEIEFDLLVLPGGPDMSVGLTDEFPINNGPDNPLFTWFYKNQFMKWVQSGTPIFGICLGFQAINTMFGGKTATHVTGHTEGDHPIICLDRLSKKPLDIVVNSRHHQAVWSQELSLELECLAVSQAGTSDKFFAEAFLHYALPIAGVQWHPEDLFLSDGVRRGDKLTHSIILKLLEFYDEKVTEDTSEWGSLEEDRPR